MNKVFFLDDTEWEGARKDGKYDLIIIGAGICALAVARRALENDSQTKILIIERGPFFLPEHFQNLPTQFQHTLGVAEYSETFPWTIAESTKKGEDGVVTWQHGMVPFFGGRSTLWSAWCPRPTKEEMAGWPEATIEAATARFSDAESLLHVQRTDQVDKSLNQQYIATVSKSRPVYGHLQRCIQTLLQQQKEKVPSVNRSEAAPLASRALDVDGVDFQKFSSTGPLLDLVQHPNVDIVTDCVVEKINGSPIGKNIEATELETSRGKVTIGSANIVLAMGTLPPTTLVRNSFPSFSQSFGKQFGAHFITAIVARVPCSDLDEKSQFNHLDIGACYVAGTADKDFKKQFHIQLTALHSKDPEKFAGIALRYMPDVVATASMAQLHSSPNHVVFVCAVLGELDVENGSHFSYNKDDPNITTNSLLRINSNGKNDLRTWDCMDEATFDILEKVLSPKGGARVEYWHGSPSEGNWKKDRPTKESRRVNALVHESSTLPLGEQEGFPVDLEYRLRGTNNVYVTGGALWPRSGSWNPTMTMVALAMHLADNLVPGEKKRGKKRKVQ